MIKVKLTTEFPDWPGIRQTPNSSGIWDNCEFIINNPVQKCDAWVVFDGFLQEETVLCNKQNLIFITAEPETVKEYHPEFLNQFNTIITSNRRIRHKNIIYKQQGLPWHISRKNQNIFKTYNDFKNINIYNKTKLISVISSNKVLTEGHKKRLDFVMALKDYFGDKIDVFGRGIHDIEDKWDAIADYKYHIALENFACLDYWTEKLADCYLGGAYPFYFGCSNLSDYFDEDSYTYIDINDPEMAIKIIEKAIEDNLYEESLQKILGAKNLVLDKYNLFAMISEYLENNPNQATEKEVISLKPENYYHKRKKSLLFKLCSKIKKI